MLYSIYQMLDRVKIWNYYINTSHIEATNESYIFLTVSQIAEPGPEYSHKSDSSNRKIAPIKTWYI